MKLEEIADKIAKSLIAARFKDADTPEDIARDVISRLQHDLRMTWEDAFKAIGYGDLYKKTRAADMPDNYEELSTEKQIKALAKTIKKAMRR